MEELLTAHVLLAILGGVVGGFRAAVRAYPPRSWWVRVSDFMVGVALASAVSAYAPGQYPMLSLAYGVVAGTVAAYALDTVHDLVPALLRMVAKVKLHLDIPPKDKE